MSNNIYVGGANGDGGETRVRTDEIKSYRTDRPNSQVFYEGRSITLNAETSASTWQIKRTIANGTQTYVQWANNGTYTCVWDDRTDPSIWPSVPSFFDVYSTQFDGINDLVSFGNVFNEFDVGNQWSMSFWVYIDNLSSQRCIYSKCTNDVNVYGINLQVTTAGKLFLQARSSTYGFNYTGLATLSSLTWYNIIVTYNGGSNFNGFRFYINSVLDQLPGAGAMAATLYSGQTAIFGARNATFYHSGNIDEVTFWTKALSQAEVTELYNGGTPNSPENHSASAFLVDWYRMGDGDVFPTITDNIGSNNGTMTNMTAANFVAEVP